MSWHQSLSTFVLVFSVGRGNAAFIRSGLNQGFIIDMGAGIELSPAEFIEQTFVPYLDAYEPPSTGSSSEQEAHSIAQAILSHPHVDHIAECKRLRDRKRLHPSLITCPHEKDGTEKDEKLRWHRIQNPGGADEIVSDYRSLYANRNPPLQTIQFRAARTVPNLEYGVYYIRPPLCEVLHPADDNKYGNATSIVFYLRHGDHTVLMPGDMTPDGMRHLLYEGSGLEKRYTVFDRSVVAQRPTWHLRTTDQPQMYELLRQRGLSILVAPHHGLESCYSHDLYKAMRSGKPQLVVISERRHRSPNDGRIDARYQSDDGASGLMVNISGKIERRRSVSTVSGHHILIVFSGTGLPRVYLDRNPELLVAIMNRQ